jgi:mycothiol synthase
VITIRPVVSEADIDTYVAVRNRIHPETPLPREVVVDGRRKPDQLDLLAEAGGSCLGAASTSNWFGDRSGHFAFLSMRVLAEHRRRGIGTMLHRRASEHARGLGKSRFYVVVRDVDEDSLGYYGGHGFEEIGRVQDVVLDVRASGFEVSAPSGIEVVPAGPEHDRGVYEVALEADADVPSAAPIVSGDYEAWHDRHFGPLVSRELSMLALEGGRVVGYAIAGRFTDDTYEHWMTGVSRDSRGRGIATALKQAQIAAARDAGVVFLRTQNDLGNAPMRRVNERLGYRKLFEWVHLEGPLLG